MITASLYNSQILFYLQLIGRLFIILFFPLKPEIIHLLCL